MTLKPGSQRPLTWRGKPNCRGITDTRWDGKQEQINITQNQDDREVGQGGRKEHSLLRLTCVKKFVEKITETKISESRPRSVSKLSMVIFSPVLTE